MYCRIVHFKLINLLTNMITINLKIKKIETPMSKSEIIFNLSLFICLYINNDQIYLSLYLKCLYHSFFHLHPLTFTFVYFIFFFQLWPRRNKFQCKFWLVIPIYVTLVIWCNLKLHGSYLWNGDNTNPSQ